MLPLVGQLKAFLAEKLDIHATSNNRSKKVLIKPINKGSGNQAVVILNAAAATQEEVLATQAIIKDAFNNGEVLLVDDETKRLASSVAVAESQTPIGETVDYFKDKLNSIDWQILRTGLYIDYLIQQGMPTAELRQGVLVRYGTRGRNILNLASAGHFQSHIRPLYEAMSKLDNFSPEKFYEELERILNEMPFAIFVNSQINAEQLCDEVRAKINQSNRNSVIERKLYIHGWGSNVKTIERCIDILNAEVNVELRVVTSKRKEVVEIIDITIEF